MSYKYAFALLKSARTFIESAVDYASRDRQEQWKFAILHLMTAIELLLKAKLAIADPRLIVDDKNHISESQFEKGEFRSISVGKCIDKISGVCMCPLDNKQRQIIEKLQIIRNRYVHYIDLDEDTAAIKAAVAAGLNLFIEVNNAEFEGEDPYGAKTMPQIVVDLYKYDEFVKERLASLAARLQLAIRPQTYHTYECSHCLQDATVIINDKLQCLFCGYGISIYHFAECLSYDGSVKVCPDCNRMSVARHQVIEDGEPTYECFCCGYFIGPQLKWSHFP